MDKLKMQTKNLANENYEKLAVLFFFVLTERTDENGNVVRAIDKDILMQEINCKVVRRPRGTLPIHLARQETSHSYSKCSNKQNPSSLSRRKCKLWHHRKPVHRRRQPWSSKTVAGNISWKNQNDLHWSTV